MQTSLPELHLLPLEPTVGALGGNVLSVETQVRNTPYDVPSNAQPDVVPVDLDLLIGESLPVEMGRVCFYLRVLLLSEQIFQRFFFNIVSHALEVADIELPFAIKIPQFKFAMFGKDVDVLPRRSRLFGHQLVTHVFAVVVDELNDVVQIVQIDLQGVVLSIYHHLHLPFLAQHRQSELLLVSQWVNREFPLGQDGLSDDRDLTFRAHLRILDLEHVHSIYTVPFHAI